MDVSIRNEGGGFVGSLAVQESQVESGVREVHANSCSACFSVRRGRAHRLQHAASPKNGVTSETAGRRGSSLRSRAVAGTAARAAASPTVARDNAGSLPPLLEVTDIAVALSSAPQLSSTPASTLDAEVAALDAVRTAISAAAFQRALRLIEQYRQEFPAGELARDADIFEIETLAAQGERGEATRQADRFLAHYPNDPHLARLRGLIGH